MKRLYNLFLLTASLMHCTYSFGQGFSVIPSGTSINLRSVHFPTEDVGYIGGDFVTLFKTTDGGDTWTELEINGVSPVGFEDDPIIDLFFFNELEGYLIVENFTSMYETSDGGLNWAPVDDVSGGMCFPRDFEVINPELQLLAGKACFGGSTVTQKVEGMWEQDGNILAQDESSILDIAISENQTVMLTSSNGSVYLSDDNGENWNQIEVAENLPITSASYRDINTVYITSSDYTGPIFISEDGGNTWQAQPDMLPGFQVGLNGVIAGSNTFYFGTNIPEGLGFIGSVYGNAEPIFQTVNSSLRAGHRFSDFDLILIGDNGLILRSDFSVDTETSDTSDDIFLYPNPAKEFVQFSNLPSGYDIMEYRLVNIVGQLTRSGQLETGRIEVADLPRGLYFVEIISSGKSLGTRKLMLN